MKKLITIIVISIIAVLIFILLPQLRTYMLRSSLTECGNQSHCSPTQECYMLPDSEKRICWDGDPCELCASKQCYVMESMPPQIGCK